MQLLEVLNGSVFPMNYIGLVQTWRISYVSVAFRPPNRGLSFLLNICIRYNNDQHDSVKPQNA